MRNITSFRHTIIWCSVVLLALTGIAGRATGKDSVPSEVDKLQGTWKLVYQEMNGKKLPDEKTAGMLHGKMVFTGSEIRYTVELPGFDFKYSYQLHPDLSPKGIDLKVTKTSDGKGVGTTMLGIYRFEGDTLEICYSIMKRPTEYGAAEGSDTVLIVLKKVSVLR